MWYFIKGRNWFRVWKGLLIGSCIVWLMRIKLSRKVKIWYWELKFNWFNERGDGVLESLNWEKGKEGRRIRKDYWRKWFIDYWFMRRKY